MDWENINNFDTDSDRKKRMKSAASAECTPVEINTEERTGVFAGSHGQYQTTLDRCSCIDFSRRKEPCKHMYRLAHELGVINLEGVISDASKIKQKEPTAKERAAAYDDGVRFLESYTEEVQKLIKEAIYHIKKDGAYIIDNPKLVAAPEKDGMLNISHDYVFQFTHTQKKKVMAAITAAGIEFPKETKTQNAKIQYCTENSEEFGPLVFPDTAVIRLAGPLKISMTKLYSYLNRKYEDENPVFYF